jgi:hypothetical protein
MPKVSEFFGIVIALYCADHALPISTRYMQVRKL